MRWRSALNQDAYRFVLLTERFHRGLVLLLGGAHGDLMLLLGGAHGGGLLFHRLCVEVVAVVAGAAHDPQAPGDQARLHQSHKQGNQIALLGQGQAGDFVVGHRDFVIPSALRAVNGTP